jgi:hypothetical protein
LAEPATPFVHLERDVWEQFRPQVRGAVQAALDARATAEATPARPICCGPPMRRHDGRPVQWLTWVGGVRVHVTRSRCAGCRAERRPLLETLEIEPGPPSGWLARQLGWLGCVASYPLAAQLAGPLFGLTVNAMTVWRAVQRLGEAAAQHPEGLGAYHAAPRSPPPAPGDAPAAVVVAVDGCMLGMQVRATRRRRRDDAARPPLPPVEEGHFRAGKTGVLMRPAERVEASPGRHTLVRRLLVTCLGDADVLFTRVWAHLREAGWLGPQTIVVVIGDGSEWIWHRAALFVRRCEILDFWHAMEYAWAYARLQFGEGTRRAAQGTRRVAQDLKAGPVQAVIARLYTLQPNTPESREALATLIRSYTTHAARMPYDEYQRLGYGSGSGAVESAHKQVVHARLRQAGMRWSAVGARRLLALRLLLLNGEWAQADQLRLVRVAPSPDAAGARAARRRQPICARGWNGHASRRARSCARSIRGASLRAISRTRRSPTWPRSPPIAPKPSGPSINPSRRSMSTPWCAIPSRRSTRSPSLVIRSALALH